MAEEELEDEEDDEDDDSDEKEDSGYEDPCENSSERKKFKQWPLLTTLQRRHESTNTF